MGLRDLKYGTQSHGVSPERDDRDIAPLRITAGSRPAALGLNRRTVLPKSEQTTRTLESRSVNGAKLNTRQKNCVEQKFSNLQTRPAICGQSQQARLRTGPSTVGSTTLSGRARLQRD